LRTVFGEARVYSWRLRNERERESDVFGLLVAVGAVIVVAVLRRFHVGLSERVANYAFFVFFAAYTAGALFWLLVGLTPAIAHAVPAFREALQNAGDGQAGLPAWCEVMAEKAAIASSGVVLEEYGLGGRQPGGLVALEYLFSAVNIALGVFLVWLRPRDWAARLLAVGMVGTGAVFNLQSHTSFQILPADVIANTHDQFHFVAGIAYILAMLLFPDGRPAFHFPELQGLRRLPLYVPGALLAFAGFAVVSGSHGTPAGFVALFGVLVPIAGIASQSVRFRHAATPEERQQSRLLLSLLTLVFLIAVIFALPILIVSESGVSVSEDARQEISRVLFRVFPPLFATIPIALFLIMVRYRLWDIDRVINRALVYTALTAILGLAYIGGIVLLELLFRPLTGGSDLAVVSTTLVVAALFQPARGRVQAAVDRAFYRGRYDAARTLDAFATRIRDEVDLESLKSDLIAVTQETMQPSHVSLWLAAAPREAGVASGRRPFTFGHPDAAKEVR
jgi:hypothetical protein